MIRLASSLPNGVHFHWSVPSLTPQISNSPFSSSSTSPLSAAKGEYPEHEGGWMDVVQRGISEVPKDSTNRWVVTGIWNCPSHNRPSISESHFSYGYNSEGLGLAADETSLGLGGHYIRRWTRSANRPVSENEVAGPSDMLALGDGVA